MRNYFAGLVISTLFISVETSQDAQSLYRNLMNNYNKVVRPVSENGKTLSLWLGLKFMQLIGVVRSDCSL